MQKLMLVSALSLVMGGAWAADRVDAIIVGSGGAGLSAAVTLHDAGRHVVVLEKMPMIGGNTLRAEGGMNAVKPSNKKRQVFPIRLNNLWLIR